MTVAVGLLTLALVALDLWFFWRYTAGSARQVPRWMDFLPWLAAALVVAYWFVSLAATELITLMALPLLVATLVLSLAGIPRRVRFRRVKTAIALLCAVLVAFSVWRLVDLFLLMQALAPRIALLEQDGSEIDLTQRSWSSAFDEMIETLKVEYPFTAHKQIDWNGLRAALAPDVAAAEAAKDARAYYRAVRELAWRVPDGHVGVGGSSHGLSAEETGGSFGLVLAQLDDRRVVVRSRIDGGPAARAGMATGDEIVSWNDRPIEEALARTTIIWGDYPPSTSEGRRLEQLRFLARAPIGGRATLVFRKRGSGSGDAVQTQTAVQTATLMAAAADRSRVWMPGPIDTIFGSAFETRRLASGYGYVRIKFVLPTLRDGVWNDTLRLALARFSMSGVPGIILDVRDNLGGESSLAARMLGHFHAQPRLYQYIGAFDRDTRTFRAATHIPLRIVPTAPRYHGPVAVLIDERSHSAAEDLAMFVRDLPNGVVVGLHGTQGAGGISEKTVALPTGCTFSFPKAQSLDSQLAITIDSDHTGHGGVTPTVRVPLDDRTMDALNSGHDVVLEYAERALAGLARKS